MNIDRLFNVYYSNFENKHAIWPSFVIREYFSMPIYFGKRGKAKEDEVEMPSKLFKIKHLKPDACSLFELQ